MTATATITAVYVNPPKTPRGPASIRDENKQYWTVWPRDVPNLPPQGAQITVEWEEGDVYQGKRQQIIRKIIGESGNTAPTSPRSNGSGHAAPAAAPSGPTLKDEMIFVQGILNAAMKAGVLHIDERAITESGEVARGAFRNLWGMPR